MQMKPCDRLLFCTAGTPHSASPRDSVTACRRVAQLGLDGMELEYVRGSFPGEARCREVRAAADENGIRLTAHGPYYINLNADDPDKQEASRRRILNTARFGGMSGAESITFHAGFYLKQDPDAVYQRIAGELAELAATIAASDYPVDIRPELTGKATQFGSLDELVDLSAEIETVYPCIDWSHLHARDGASNSTEAFQAVIDRIRDRLGPDVLGRMHMHVAGIEYTGKGERKHLNLEESDMRWRELLEVLKANDVRGILICESPSIEDDALLMKSYYDTL